MNTETLIDYIHTNGLSRTVVVGLINQSLNFPLAIKAMAYLTVMQMSDSQISSMADITEKALTHLASKDFQGLHDLMIVNNIPEQIASLIVEYGKSVNLDQV
jgi:hypothetical protein